MTALRLLQLLLLVTLSSALRLQPSRLLRLGSAIVAGCLVIPTSPLLANDVDEEVIMVPRAVQESSRAPQPVGVRAVSEAQPPSEDDPSYRSSLQREKQKQEERKRARASGKYRNDLCESLGRGC